MAAAEPIAVGSPAVARLIQSATKSSTVQGRTRASAMRIGGTSKRGAIDRRANDRRHVATKATHVAAV
jgi:hypothetical protein